MGTKQFFQDDSGSEADESHSSLPFPKPIHRSAFLVAGFEPTTFLADLSDRFQTLEDLRKELRDLSQSLGKELLDLVNDNYQDFLSLGNDLQGGEEKTEMVQVALMGTQRDLEFVQDNIAQRRIRLAALIDDKKKTVKRTQDGEALLEIAEQIDDLEAALMLSSSNPAVAGMDQADQGFLEESDDENEGTVSITRLERLVEQYRILSHLISRLNPLGPFVISQADRMARLKSILSLDLDGALKTDRSEQHQNLNDTQRAARLQELMRSIQPGS